MLDGSVPVLWGPREDNVSSSLREIRREKGGKRPERWNEKRLGCEVNARPEGQLLSGPTGMATETGEGYPDLPVSRFLFDYSSLSGILYVKRYLTKYDIPRNFANCTFSGGLRSTLIN